MTYPNLAGSVRETEDVEHASPAERRRICLSYLEKAKCADSLDDMLACMSLAELWAEGADWQGLPPKGECDE